VPTWAELRAKLQAAEDEITTLAIDAANTKENLTARLKQYEDSERRLRGQIRRFELKDLKKQHAALKTGQYTVWTDEKCTVV